MSACETRGGSGIPKPSRSNRRRSLNPNLRHVKTVKTHIMQFVDIVTTKKADAGAGGYKKEVVGKKGYLKEVAVYEKWKKIIREEVEDGDWRSSMLPYFR